MAANRLQRLLPLLVLIAASLACQTVTRLVSSQPTSTPISTPRPRLTPTKATPRPTGEPKPSPTPAVPPTARPTLPATFDDLEQFRAAMRPAFAADVDEFPHATRYTLEVAVTFNDDGSATLTGRERLRYTNQQDFALNDLVLMLWPSDTFSGEYLSQMTLHRVWLAPIASPPGSSTWDEVQPEMENEGLTARISLPSPLEPGVSVELSTEFTVQAFAGVDTHGAARFGLTQGVLLAPTFYPLVPRVVEGEWQTTPASPGGDTTNSDSAFYVWRVTAPADMAIVGTGSVVERTTSGQTQTQTLVTGPMRDLALVVGPLQLSRREVAGITLNAYLLQQDAEYAEKMLDFAEGQVRTLQSKVGSYPFVELDLVDAPGAFGGIEYPGEVFIGVVDDSGFFERATVHEVGHQWFYSLIGDDQLREPWLDEAAASYTEVLYAENIHGAQAARAALREFRSGLKFTDQPELPIGLGVGDYPSDFDYGTIVYYKGALFFDTLRQALGDKTFFAFLHNYYDQYRYGFATSTDFQAVAEQTCTCDLDALFDLWVYKGGPLPEP